MGLSAGGAAPGSFNDRQPGIHKFDTAGGFAERFVIDRERTGSKGGADAADAVASTGKEGPEIWSFGSYVGRAEKVDFKLAGRERMRDQVDLVVVNVMGVGFPGFDDDFGNGRIEKVEGEAVGI